MKNKLDVNYLSNVVRTPAFICDDSALTLACEKVKKLSQETNINQFFPLKCHSLVGSLQIISKFIDGFAVSSLFEAQLAREILGDKKRIHFTSPGLSNDEIEPLLNLCDGISFNSLSQWEQFKEKALNKVSCGLRVNPKLSYIKDDRYDPCRYRSRLGAPLEQVKQVLFTKSNILNGIDGIHFHTNCDATDWSPLLDTVQHLDAHIPDLLKQCSWINLGGGYILEEDTDLSAFESAVRLLQNKYCLNVIIELGSGVVRDACYLIAQVVDLFISDGMEIAVLDTTVNHMPEIFEYQFSPDVLNDTNEGSYSYMLTGKTCLAGDIFGEYAFDTPLAIGSKVTFTSVGAYTLVKSHMFNGVNLPSVYAYTAAGELEVRKHFSYEDFRQKLELGEHHESIRNINETYCSTGARKSA